MAPSRSGLAKARPLARGENLVNQIVGTLRKLIVSGELAPGSVLIQEDVAARLGVSRTPLREALRILQSDGLVEVVGTNRSVVVEVGDDDVRDLLELREALDSLAARLAASRPQSEKTIARLRSLARRLEEAVEPFDVSKFLTAHLDFHTAIIEASGNKRLLQLIPEVRVSALMLYRRLQTNPDRMKHSAHEHTEIVDAIAGGRADEAALLAAEHVRHTIATWAHHQAELAAESA